MCLSIPVNTLLCFLVLLNQVCYFIIIIMILLIINFLLKGDEHALILRLLQFGVPYVSVISSGYEGMPLFLFLFFFHYHLTFVIFIFAKQLLLACHAMFKEGRIYIESHNEASCLICTGNSPPPSTVSFISLPNNNISGESTSTSSNNVNEEDKEKSSLSSLFNSGKLSKMTASFMSGGKKLAENMNNIKSLLKTDKDDRPLDDIDISGLGMSFYLLSLHYLISSNIVIVQMQVISEVCENGKCMKQMNYFLQRK